MEQIEQFEHYTRPFIHVTVDTFKNFVNCNLVPRVPYMVHDEDSFERDVTGLIGLSGAIRGTVILSMKKAVAIKLTENLTGSPHTEIDYDVTDAIGEIVNIISGNMKKDVQGGDNIKISLPTIVRGKDHILSWPSKHARILCIPFTIFETEIIHLLVAFEPESQGSQ